MKTSGTGRPSAVVDVLRLVLFSAYAITLLTLNVMHFEREATLAVNALAIALWLTLAVDYALQWRGAESRTLFLRHALAYPIYLATIVFVTAHSPGVPLSEDGIALSFVLALCGLIVAIMLTAAIANWIVGAQQFDKSLTPSADSTEKSPIHEGHA